MLLYLVKHVLYKAMTLLPVEMFPRRGFILPETLVLAGLGLHSFRVSDSGVILHQDLRPPETLSEALFIR